MWAEPAGQPKERQSEKLVFAHCLNMFRKTWIIQSKLYTHKHTRHNCGKWWYWWQNDTHLHQMNKRAIFHFSSMEGMFSPQPETEVLNLKSHFRSAFYSKRQNKKQHTIHDCKHRKTQLCTRRLLDPAVWWGLARGSHQHHKHMSSLAEYWGKSSLGAESTPGLTSTQFLCRPFSHFLQKRQTGVRLAVIYALSPSGKINSSLEFRNGK